jgi:hypothetical protein
MDRLADAGSPTAEMGRLDALCLGEVEVEVEVEVERYGVEIPLR